MSSTRGRTRDRSSFRERSQSYPATRRRPFPRESSPPSTRSIPPRSRACSRSSVAFLRAGRTTGSIHEIPGSGDAARPRQRRPLAAPISPARSGARHGVGPRASNCRDPRELPLERRSGPLPARQRGFAGGGLSGDAHERPSPTLLFPPPFLADARLVRILSPVAPRAPRDHPPLGLVQMGEPRVREARGVLHGGSARFLARARRALHGSAQLHAPPAAHGVGPPRAGASARDPVGPLDGSFLRLP